MHRRLLPFHDFQKLESPDRAPLVRQFVFVQFAQPEVLPPARFVLPPVELHHVRQREARALLVRPLGGVVGHPLEESVADTLQFLVESADVLAGFSARLLPGAASGAPGIRLPRATSPASRAGAGSTRSLRGCNPRNDAGMLVAGVQRALRHRGLDQAHALRRLAQVLLPPVPEERLEILDRVALGRRDRLRAYRDARHVAVHLPDAHPRPARLHGPEEPQQLLDLLEAVRHAPETPSPEDCGLCRPCAVRACGTPRCRHCHPVPPVPPSGACPVNSLRSLRRPSGRIDRAMVSASAPRLQHSPRRRSVCAGISRHSRAGALKPPSRRPSAAAGTAPVDSNRRHQLLT